MTRCGRAGEPASRDYLLWYFLNFRMFSLDLLVDWGHRLLCARADRFLDVRRVRADPRLYLLHTPADHVMAPLHVRYEPVSWLLDAHAERRVDAFDAFAEEALRLLDVFADRHMVRPRALPRLAPESR